MFKIGSIGGLVVLVLNIWAIVSIMGSGATTQTKVLWICLVLLIPLVGFIIWLIVGPKAR